MRKYTPLLGLIGVLAASVALDFELLQLRRIVTRSLIFKPLLWGLVLSPLIWGVIVGLLAWWVLFRAGPNRVVLALFIVIGLLAELAPISLLVGISLTAQTGVVAILIGVAGLLWRKELA